MLVGNPTVIGAEDLAARPRRAAKAGGTAARERPTVAELEREAERDALVLQVVIGPFALFALAWLSCWP